MKSNDEKKNCNFPKTEFNLFSYSFTHFQWYWQWEFAEQSPAFSVGDHFLNRHDLTFNSKVITQSKTKCKSHLRIKDLTNLFLGETKKIPSYIMNALWSRKEMKGKKNISTREQDWFNFKFSNLNYVKCIANSAENSCFDLMSERVKSEMGIKNTTKTLCLSNGRALVRHFQRDTLVNAACSI